LKLKDILYSNDINALYIILEYVYSFSEERRRALSNILRHESLVASSKFSIKLPKNLIVYRWFDLIEKEYAKFIEDIHTIGFHNLNFQPVSFSILKPEQLNKTFNKSYGFIICKNLAKMNGNIVVVHNILKQLAKTDFLENIVKNHKENRTYSELIELFVEVIGCLRKYYQYGQNQYSIHKEEIAYEEQKEILVFSEDTKIIRKEELMIDLNRENT